MTLIVTGPEYVAPLVEVGAAPFVDDPVGGFVHPLAGLGADRGQRVAHLGRETRQLGQRGHYG